MSTPTNFAQEASDAPLETQLLPSQIEVPFFLRAVGLPEFLDFHNQEAESSTMARPNPPPHVTSSLTYSRTSITSHDRKYRIIPISLLPFESDTPDTGAPVHDITSLELPEWSEDKCKRHFESLISPGTIFPWDKLNGKVLEGHTLGHISDVEVVHWELLHSLHIERCEGGEEQILEPDLLRSALNDILWWGIAIDMCCDIEEIDAVLHEITSNNGQFELGFEELGILVVVGEVQQGSDGGNLDTQGK